MKRTLLALAGLLACGVPGRAQGPGAVAAERASAPSGLPAETLRAVRESDEAFLKAFNAGDSRAVADLFAEDAEAVDETGTILRGREAIRAVFAETFADRPGWKMALQVESVRLVAPEVALETGRTTLTPADGSGPHHAQFSAVLVRRDGRWLQTYVRELPEPVIDPQHRLQDLSWLLGDWIDEGPTAVVTSSGKWSPDRRYLLREFTTHFEGKPEMTVSQRIGWDPSTKQIKSWVFDSEGGHSEALWSRADGRWVAKATGVLADGRTATATHVYTVEGKHRIKYRSIDRTVGSEALPDGDEVTLVPRPPGPRR